MKVGVGRWHVQIPNPTGYTQGGSFFLETIPMDNLQLLKIRLLRAGSYRCQVVEWQVKCWNRAHNIAKLSGQGWTPVCHSHLEHGEGYL